MSVDGGELRKTPLYECHVRHGGNIVDFGGWALPTNYPPGILAEHRAVREGVGLFDVSHMGEIRISGPESLDLLQKLVPNDVARLEDNQIQYTQLLYPTGGIVDDLLVYRVGPREYYLVVNASNREKDVQWICDVAAGFQGAEVIDESDDTAELAIQGPRSAEVLSRLVDEDASRLRYFWFYPSIKVGGIDCLVSRTGYTGEDGFEIFCSPDRAVALWDAVMKAGEASGLMPIGLGARDSLRFEAGMPLYGQELTEDTTPLEAGLGRFLALDKGDFIGRDALVTQKERGISRRLVGFEMIDRAIPRTHYPIIVDGSPAGEVTTGSYAPSLEKNIGMGYVPVDASKTGTEIGIDVRGRVRSARIVKLPFYKRKKEG